MIYFESSPANSNNMTMIAKLCPAKIRHRSSLSSLLFLCLLFKSSPDSLLSLLFNSSLYGPSSKSFLRPPSESSAEPSTESVRTSKASLRRLRSPACPSSRASLPSSCPLSIKKLRKNRLPKDSALNWPNLILFLLFFNFGQLDASRFSNSSSRLSPDSSPSSSYSSLDSSANLSSRLHSTNSTKNGAFSASFDLMSFFSQLSNVSQTSGT